MRRVLAALSAFAVLVLGFQAPAQAALSDCWNSTVCLFAHGAYGNPIWRQLDTQINGCRSLVGTGWNDVTTSAANQYTNGRILVLWEHSNCTGSYYQLPGDTIVDFTGYWWDNKVSAVQIILV
jgi:hypothetical protein